MGEESGSQAPVRWTLGAAELDERAMELRVNGTHVDVERKALELLRFLLLHHGELVTKDQMLEAVWPGRIVTEASLTKAIAKLREALGPAAERVVTVHGYGYRLDGEVTHASTDAPSVADGSSTKVHAPSSRPALSASRPVLIAGVVAVAALLALGAWNLVSEPTRALDKSVAVLPFTNMSANAEHAWFADGMQDEVLTALAKIGDLKVISRTSVEKYRGVKHDLRTIARELDVATVVEGAVQRDGERVRINVQLIDAQSDAHLWAETYDRQLDDVFAVQTEIARQVADSLRATLLPAEERAIAAVPTQDPAAYDLYLQGLSDASRFRTEYVYERDPVGRAEQRFEAALSRDPAFALAAAELARLHMEIYWLGPTRERTALRRAAGTAAAERALALDPDLGEAHLSMALVHYWGHYDYAAALAELEQARKTLPGDAAVPSTAAAIARRQGRWTVALSGFSRAARLDPQVAAHWSALTFTSVVAGEMDQARAFLERSVAVARQPAAQRISLEFAFSGATADLAALRAAINEAPDAVLTTPDSRWAVYYLHRWERDHAAALQLLDGIEGDWLEGLQSSVPVAALRGDELQAMGQVADAKAAFDQARRHLEEALEAQPDNGGLWGTYAQVQAALGQREAAQGAGLRVLGLLPPEQDVYSGPFVLYILAEVHQRLGEHAAALERLRELAGYDAAVGGRANLLFDPLWDPLRDEPRFTEVIPPLPRPRTDSAGT